MPENSLTTTPSPDSETAASWRPLAFDLFVVLLMAVGVTALDVQWALLNQAPPRGDDNSHLCSALWALWNVSASSPPSRALSLFLLYPNHYPPLTYQVTLLFFGLFGVHPWVPILSFFPFLLVLGASMYGIGAGLANRAVGLACALITLTSPVVLNFSRTYYLDMPSTAMLALSLCSLIYSRDFTRRGWSVLFGISMALGVLSKWTHPIFILPFVLLAVGRAVRNLYAELWPSLLIAFLMATTLLLATLYVLQAPAHIDGITVEQGPDFAWTPWGVCVIVAFACNGALRMQAVRHAHLRTLANLLEAFTLAILLAWPWYYFNGEKVRYKIVYQANVLVDASQALQSYQQDLSGMLAGAPILILVGILVGAWWPRLRIWTALLVACIALSVGLATRLPPDSRYIMPVIVFVVPLSLVWSAHLTSARSSLGWRRCAVALQALVLLGVSAIGVWGAVGSLQPGFGCPLANQQPWVPEQGRYPYSAVLKTLRARQSGLIWVAVLEGSDDAGQLQPRSFLYAAALEHLDLVVIETAEGLQNQSEVHDIEQARHFLVIYRAPSMRAELLAEAWRRGWIAQQARPVERFDFSPDFHVDIYDAARSAKPAGT